MNKRRLVVLCVIFVGIIWMAGISMFAPGATVLGSLGDREVLGQAKARKGPARFLAEGPTATVQLGSSVAKVSADEVQLPGGRTIKIPQECKKIKLVETRNGMRLFFDGREHQ